MTTTQNLTPAQAFDQLKERVASGLPVRGKALLTGGEGRGERFRYDNSVLDQNVTLPARRVPVTAILHVVAVDNGGLVLQLVISWTSIYGQHSSATEYVATKRGSKVDIAPQWWQTLPKPTLDNLEVHTGGVSVEDYHRKTVEELRASGKPIASMLSSSKRTVDAHDLVVIAGVVQRSMPLL